MYLRLDYRAYKRLELQLRHWEQIETAHTSVDGFYHKALRLDIGDLTLEIQGPAVKAPLRETNGETGLPLADPAPVTELRAVREQRCDDDPEDW